jgi:tetratricopeptide (TPR) repeat protein
MLSLANDGRYPTLDLTPEQRRQRTLQALVSQMEVLARQSPVLMLFEDAHWSDPTSLEAFGRVIDLIAGLRVLLLVTFRPEFPPPWIGQPHVTSVTLNRLPRRDIDAMIDGVLGNKPLPASIRQDIIERTDGIPLFVEEMTKAVLEARSEGEAQQTAAAIPVPALAVPASLQASLMARLDRLGTAKDVAQIGAAMGREFSHALLSAVVSKPKAELESTLDRLIAAGLLFRQGVPPHANYLFKHALVQDAAYGTLLREPRRVLHAHIAATLQSQFPDTAESQPELLARHCTEAGLIEKAADLWGKAGHRSLERSALVEAAEQLTRALEQIAQLSPTPALRREQIKLQVALIAPLIHVKGYAARETAAATEHAHLLIQQAEALGESPEDPLLLFSVLYSSWARSYVAFKSNVVLELATQFLTLAERQKAAAPLMIGHRLMGTSLLMTGSVAEARTHLDQAIALYDPKEHRRLAVRFGQDVREAALSLRSLALWILGYPDTACADAEAAISEARVIGQAATLLHALYWVSLPYVYCGKYTAAKPLFGELVALAENKSVGHWKPLGMLQRGCELALSGNPADAVHAFKDGISAYQAIGATLILVQEWPRLARAYADLGRLLLKQRAHLDRRHFARIGHHGGDPVAFAIDLPGEDGRRRRARSAPSAPARRARPWPRAIQVCPVCQH